MLFGGYEHWMLRFWTLRKLDAMLLDALIATHLFHLFIQLWSFGKCSQFPFFPTELNSYLFHFWSASLVDVLQKM